MGLDIALSQNFDLKVLEADRGAFNREHRAGGWPFGSLRRISDKMAGCCEAYGQYKDGW